MLDLRKRDIHPYLMRNHGDDINKPPADGYKRFGLQNTYGIAKDPKIEAFDVIQATITETNVAMTMEQKAH